MIDALTDGEIWAQALALEAMLGARAREWIAARAAELQSDGDEVGAGWMRDMQLRLDLLASRTAERN